MSGGGGGGSESVTTSQTQTTTEQQDNRATGTDSAVVFAHESIGDNVNLNIEQIPPAVLTVFQDVLTLAQNAGQAAISTAQQAQANAQEQKTLDQQNQKLLLGGMLGIAAILTLAKKGNF